MHEIRLSPGQTYPVPGRAFTGWLQVGLSGGLDFQVEIPDMETRRRGAKVWLRNPAANTEITISPGYGDTHFPTGTKLFVTLHVTTESGQELQLEFPTFEVGGLKSFPAAVILPGLDAVRIVVSESVNESNLDEDSAGVRSALRRSIDRDSLPEGRRRDVVMIVDVTSSMQNSTSREAFDAMCTFAAGVLSTSSGDRVLRLATSSESFVPESLSGPEAVRQLAERDFSAREVGWSLEVGDLDPEAALVVISDDLPAEVAAHPGVVHVLTQRPPVFTAGASVTVFDDKLISAVRDQNSEVLARPTRGMFDALTMGEK